MSKVYIVQKQLRQDENGELVPKFDLTSAARYGELVYLLSPTAGPFNSASVIGELQRKLSDYSPNDYLLLIGNPCLIGWAVCAAYQATGGPLTLLQWSGKSKSYIPVACNVPKANKNSLAFSPTQGMV